jgi:hypothetical protein
MTFPSRCLLMLNRKQALSMGCRINVWMLSLRRASSPWVSTGMETKNRMKESNGYPGHRGATRNFHADHHFACVDSWHTGLPLSVADVTAPPW